MKINRIKTGISIFLFISVAILPFRMQAQEGWTLRQCVEYAIEHNLTVLRTENQVKQSEVDVNTAKWARLPDLNGSASQSFNWGRTISSETNGYVNSRNTYADFSLKTNVPLFTGFELPNRYALAKLDLRAAVEDLNKAKEDISISVISAYLQVLFNGELLNVAKEQVTLSKEQLTRMIRMEEVGKASPAQVADARARVAQDEMSVVQAKNDYNLSLLELTQLLELPTPEGFTLAVPQEEPLFFPLTSPDEIYLQAVPIKSSILAAQYRLEGSAKNIRIAQSGYYPKLSFGGNLNSGFGTLKGKAGENFFSQLDNRFGQSIGVSLSVPLFNRFSTRNRVRTAKLQQTLYSIRLDEAKKELYKEIQQAWYNAVAAEAKYRSGEAAVFANESAFRLMREKFENGKATSIEYSEAKLNLMKAVSERIQAKYDYLFRTKVLIFYKGEPIY